MPRHLSQTRMTRCLPLAAGLLLALAGCTSTSPATPTDGPQQMPVPRDQDPVMPAPTTPPASATTPDTGASDAASACNADAAQSFVGKPASDENVAGARAAAGAKGGVRVIAPGMAVTMDFRPDRLNLEVDAQRVITTVRCG